MIEITRILCPVDFSDFSQHALAHAGALARWYDARLTVMYVYGIGIPPAALAPGMGPVGAEALILSLEDENQFMTDLRRLAADAGVSGDAVELKVLQGNVVESILEEAQSTRADLVVVGTHGRAGFERLVLGSVTEKLLRKLPCSVLTVPPRAATPPAARLFSNIVLATDFSEAATRALAHALSLAQEANARLTLVHVVEVPEATGEWIYTTTDMETLVHSAMTASREQLAAAVPAAARDWCQVKERVEAGRSYREILRVAREEGADLIVVGAQGHGVIDRLLFGSTASHVVRQATCPVLAVR
jgi:nucleotide-binding universal stress UspA family protein